MKKITFLISIIVILISSTNAQPWEKNLQLKKGKINLTLKDYQKAFNDYWNPYNVDNGFYLDDYGIRKKAYGWKQFKRWEYFWQNQVDSLGNFPERTALEVYQNYQIENPQLKSPTSANWKSLGPDRASFDVTEGDRPGIGRIDCIAFHPTAKNTYWVGAPSGGLWVTTDDGNSWKCLTDNNPVLGISDIVIPTDYEFSNTIYIATGDRDNSANNSAGVLKSTDSGANWEITGLNFNLSEYKKVNRLLLDPNDNNTIIAATSDGVFKTTNGGISWNLLYSVSFIDMEYKPTDYKTLFGSTITGDIYTSIDSGNNWIQSLSTNQKRIELAVSNIEPTWIYAIIGNSEGGLYGIYKSTNSGISFQRVFAGTTFNLLSSTSSSNVPGGQAWYDLSIAVSPLNANVVVVGGILSWRSTNGGYNWNTIPEDIHSVHIDKHALKYRENGDLFECNDGGITYSNDNGTNFIDKTNGLVISQMYKLGVAQTNKNMTFNGLQDIGGRLFDEGNWIRASDGDGMECIIDYKDENTQYLMWENSSNLTRTKDRWKTVNKNITPFIAGKGAWVTPIIMDPINNKTLYAGYSDVWKTTDQGDNWMKISSFNDSQKILTLAISSSNNKILFAAHQNKIWKTIDGGINWNDLSSGIPSYFGITSLTVKNDDPDIVWMTCGGYSNQSIFQSNDGGITWTNISSGLPNLPFYSIVQNKQDNIKNQLYACAEIGVYFKNGEDNWIPFNNGLPNVKTSELEIYYAENPNESKLRLATYGRGLWESNLVGITPAIPMVYESATATQTNTSGISQGTINQEIIGVHVVITGNSTPINATSFTFSTNGSTNATTDIANAKLWYTGSNNTFADTTQVGATSISPNGAFTITGSQVLLAGTNYFWLTYDLKVTATVSNVVDTECNSITVAGSTRIPALRAPAGSRVILDDPCIAGITNFSWNEGFENGSLPSCWTQEYISENNSWTFQAGGHIGFPAAAHSGSNNAFFFSVSKGVKTKLITPKLNLSSVNSPELTFWHTQENWGNDQDELRVYYKTSASGSWVLLASYTSSIASWSKRTISLPTVSNDYYIAFEGFYNYGFGVCIDDINIAGIAICTPPTSPSSATATLTTIIPGQSTTLKVNGGVLNSAPDWVWYTGSCEGTKVGTGTSLSVSPTKTTTYYVRASACGSSTICREVTVTVNGNNNNVIDIDGNEYTTVIIGSQIWLGQNLKTTKYNDSIPIPLVTDGYTWDYLTSAAYCWYENDISYKNPYGALYNWAVVNSGKLCPLGWHVPTDAEWTALTDYLGGEMVAGDKLKEKGNAHWQINDKEEEFGVVTNPTNETGFTALPGGSRTQGYSGWYWFLGYDGTWWSSSENNSKLVSYRTMLYYSPGVFGMEEDIKNYGLSVRCLCDYPVNSKIISDDDFIKVYPNPTTGILTIEGLPENEKAEIALYNMNSKQVKVHTSYSSLTRMDIRDVVSGFYLLVINNRFEQAVKIIKK